MVGDLKEIKTEKISDYLFEPDKEKVLEYVLPKLVETQILQAALESAASEQSARMMAMRSASDAATDMITELNLNFNKARQAGITQEIAEIAGGAAALE
jgi:F-type H+-transporting ATPase subunit gamma